MHRMHVVLLAPDLHGKSGWSRAALDLAHGLMARGHKVTALVCEEAETDVAQEVMLRPPMRLLSNPLLCFWDAIKLRRMLLQVQPNVVHVIAEPYAMVLGMASVPHSTTCVTVHGSYAAIPFQGNALTKMLMSYALKKVTRIITVSNFTKGYLLEHAGPSVGTEVLKPKIRVIPNAIDFARFPLEKAEKEQQTPAHILSVGAIKARKGCLQAIEACSVLKDNNVPFQYDMIGSLEEVPEYVEELKQMIVRLDLSDHVHLLGAVSEERLQQAFAKADVFLMPSRHEGPHVEGFGIVFLEANAWGVPVVGPNTGGCPEAIKDGETGYVVDPNHPQMIAEALRKILVEKKISSDACRRWAEEHGIGKIAAMVEDAYKA